MKCDGNPCAVSTLVVADIVEKIWKVVRKTCAERCEDQEAILGISNQIS